MMDLGDFANSFQASSLPAEQEELHGASSSSDGRRKSREEGKRRVVQGYEVLPCCLYPASVLLPFWVFLRDQNETGLFPLLNLVFCKKEERCLCGRQHPAPCGAFAPPSAWPRRGGGSGAVIQLGSGGIAAYRSSVLGQEGKALPFLGGMGQQLCVSKEEGKCPSK